MSAEITAGDFSQIENWCSFFACDTVTRFFAAVTDVARASSTRPHGTLRIQAI